MRFLFFLVVLILLAAWTAYYLRPIDRRKSNLLYVAAAILALLTLAGWFRLV